MSQETISHSSPKPPPTNPLGLKVIVQSILQNGQNMVEEVAVAEVANTAEVPIQVTTIHQRTMSPEHTIPKSMRHLIIHPHTLVDLPEAIVHSTTSDHPHQPILPVEMVVATKEVVVQDHLHLTMVHPALILVLLIPLGVDVVEAVPAVLVDSAVEIIHKVLLHPHKVLISIMPLLEFTVHLPVVTVQEEVVVADTLVLEDSQEDHLHLILVVDQAVIVVGVVSPRQILTNRQERVHTMETLIWATVVISLLILPQDKKISTILVDIMGAQAP